MFEFTTVVKFFALVKLVALQAIDTLTRSKPVISLRENNGIYIGLKSASPIARIVPTAHKLPDNVQGAFVMETANGEQVNYPEALPVVLPLQSKPTRKPTQHKGKVAAKSIKASKPAIIVLPEAPANRKELQAMAKQNGIKANLSNVEIVSQLRAKGIVA